MNRFPSRTWFASAVLSVLGICGAQAASGPEVYRAMGIETSDVLAGTVLRSQVLPGAAKQVICVATFFTGKKDKAEAVNVRLAIFTEAQDRLAPVYSRDLIEAYGGPLSDGELQVLDLDADGVNEVIVSFDSFADPLIEQRLTDIIVYAEAGFEVAWAGPVEYDATRAARGIPAERRDRFVREIDIVSTLRTKGVTLFMDKKVIAVAGERLAEPKIVKETFPLRPAREPW
jgi:hypothetical protein